MTSSLALALSCITALVPEPTLRDLAQLRAASEERGGGVNALELSARRHDLQSRLALIAATGKVDMVQLWRLLGEMGGVGLPAAVATETVAESRVITDHKAAWDGRDLQNVLRDEALRMGQAGLIAAIDKGFTESFHFTQVPANREYGVAEPFELQTTPVTQGQFMVWRYSRGETSEEVLPWCRSADYAEGDHIDLGGGVTINYDHPVERVLASEALEFIAWLNGKPAVAASGCRYHLLNHAQYLHAVYWSRGIPRSQERFYEKYSDALEYAYLNENSVYENPRNGVIGRLGRRRGTHVVSGLKADSRGLRHLLGNVMVWMTDANGTGLRVGGCGFFCDPPDLRAGYRVDRDERRDMSTGLRLVRTCP